MSPRAKSKIEIGEQPQKTTVEKKYVETPLMKQYYQIKAVHPDAILLFRVGDFYETFGDDAIKASAILGITLTKRANGSASSVELAGFPYHALDTYMPKLVRAGQRVAICEQLEDPKMVKGLVKRGVIELVTPGIVMGENLVAGKENTAVNTANFDCRVFKNDRFAHRDLTVARNRGNAVLFHGANRRSSKFHMFTPFLFPIE